MTIQEQFEIKMSV